MPEPVQHILALDCLPFPRDTLTANVLQAFMESQKNSVFWFTPGYNADEDSKLAEYDYRKQCWTAGRFVGEAVFLHDTARYRITIKPRFGEKMLLHMLETIFNIKITSSAGEASKHVDWQQYIKRIIAFIWLQKLANANLHGVPRTHFQKEHIGEQIRGRLDVRRSMKPLYGSNKVVSSFREKRVDQAVAKIIFEAYRILAREFDVGSVNMPDSAREAINQIHTAVTGPSTVTDRDYYDLKYKDIYVSWKGVVDLSWDIIRRRHVSLKQTNANSGIGFFIDMAEVWEQYLRSILKKHLLPLGWSYVNEKQTAYTGYFWQRDLIPDLIFQNDSDIAIWDAKYKRMTGSSLDVDRSDFFQIHTYIQFHLHHKTVKAGGLLYPILTKVHSNYMSPFLIHENGQKMNFTIDGVELSEASDNNDYRKSEAEFVRRVVKSLG